MASREFNDASIPDDLSPKGRQAAEAIIGAVTALKDGKPPYTGGCRAFYSPEAWRERGESDVPRETVLVVVHDGGDFAPMFNLDYCQDRWFMAGDRALTRAKCWAEAQTNWHTFIYRH